MDLAQMNYTTMEKELMTIVFALDKFRSYMLGFKVIVFFDHTALKFLLKKPDAKSRLIWWLLKDVENSAADYLSKIEREIDPMLIRDDFPNEQLLQIDTSRPWYADICNFLIASIFPPGASRTDREKLKSEAKYYVRDDPYLYNSQVYSLVLHFFHSIARGGHYKSTRTAWKVLECRFYWPTIFRDAHQFASAYKPC
ncbi:Retrovirus-related Pol polyprotein from transposon 17.6, partial [Mucuna pruriens]